MRTHAYARIAAGYDGAGWLYSGGAIGACRRWSGGRCRPGERVLVAGCGTGVEVVAAARTGARVTAVDVSPAMHRRAQRRCQRCGVADRVTLLCQDVLNHGGRDYDVVVAPFFLNLFAAPRLPGVLAALRERLVPGGQLVVGDFAGARRPVGFPPMVFARRLYHDVPMWLFAGLGANDVHPPHDLPVALAASGLRVRDRVGFRLFAVGPAWIEGWVAARDS